MNNFDINTSPIFKLSMCSLENFHTNFLEWLGNAYPQKFVKLFDYGEYDASLLKVVSQKRYKNNILDLMVLYDDKPLVVIENKIKSYPKKSQLDSYNEIDDVKCAKRRILLSFAPVVDSLKNSVQNWDYIQYSEFLNSLKTVFDNTDESYYGFLISDYLGALEIITALFPKTSSQLYDYYGYNELCKYGLEDVYVKFRTSELADYIHKKFNEKLSVWTSFNNKKGTIQIEFNEYLNEIGDRVFYIGTQLEQQQYRYFICFDDASVDDNSIRQFMTKLRDEKLWFVDTIDVNGKIYSDEKFGCYSKDYLFLYRYSKFKDKFKKDLEFISYEDIAEKISNDKELCEKSWEKILQIAADLNII